MHRAVVTTVLYGWIGALTVMPATGLLTALLGRPRAFEVALWGCLCGYGLLLAHWGGRSARRRLLALTLPLGVALWPGPTPLFLFIALAALSLMRSGLGFRTGPVRAALAEVVTVGGAVALVAPCHPQGAVAWSVAIWLFFLVQSLYFFMVPVAGPSPPAGADPFERACQQVRRIVEA